MFPPESPDPSITSVAFGKGSKHRASFKVMLQAAIKCGLNLPILNLAISVMFKVKREPIPKIHKVGRVPVESLVSEIL